MAWTYSDWIEQTDAATRVTRLRSHIREVSDRVTGATSKPDGESYNPDVLQKYLAELREELREQDPDGVGGDVASSAAALGGFTQGRARV